MMTKLRIPWPTFDSGRVRLPLAGILLLALLLRVALFAAAWHNAPDLHTLVAIDTISYAAPAESLLADGTFSRDGAPEIVRTPGYPLLLTVGLLLGHVELVTIALQIILSVASVALIYDLAWELTASSSAALAASALAALEPLSIIFTVHLLSETLFAFLLLASFSLLLRYLRTSSALALVATALILAAATFVRPISYYLPPVIALLLLVRAWTRSAPPGQAIAPPNGRLREAVLAMTFVAVCFSPLAAWQVRNYMLTGYGGFAAIAESDLYFCHGLSIVAHQSGKPLKQLRSEMGACDDQLFKSLHPELRDADQAAKFRYLKTEGCRLLRGNILTYAKIHAAGTLNLAIDSGAVTLLCVLDRYPKEGLVPLSNDIRGLFRRAQLDPAQHCYLRWAFRVALGLIYCACALGLVVAWHRLSWQWTLVLVTSAYFLALSGGPLGYCRLRHPVMPVICILAGYGIATLLSHFWARRQSDPGQSALTPAGP